MPLYALDECAPDIAADVAWIAPDATLVGHVRVKKDASIWFGAVLRGDNALIEVGQGSNVQDGSILHTDIGFPLVIGNHCTIGHRAILHGCVVGDTTLVGMGATILNGAVIGRNCLIGANTLISEGKIIPDNSLVVGAPGKVIRQLDAVAVAGLAQSAAHYIANGQRFAKGLRAV